MDIRGEEAGRRWVCGALVLAACACSHRGALSPDGATPVDADTADRAAPIDADTADGAVLVDADTEDVAVSVNDASIFDVAGSSDTPSVVDIPVSGADSGTVDTSAADTNWEVFSPCPLVVSGEPVFVDFAAGSISRSLVVLDRGDPRVSPPRLVHVALQAMVDRPSDAEIHSADLHLPAAWPTALPLNHPEGVVGPAAHSAAIARVTPDGRTLVLTYYGHPTGSSSALQLLPIDVATWVAGPFTTVASGQWAVSRDMASGPGLEPESAFAGQGFGIVWSVYSPAADADELQAGVLRANGAVSSGPWLLQPRRASSSVIWSGANYLFAVVSPGSLIVARAPTGTDAPKLQPVSTFPFESTEACCTTLAAYGGVVWAAWFERAGGDGSNTQNVRLVRLTPDGTAQEAPVTIAGAVPATGWLRMTANRNGALVAWMESSTEGVLLQLRQFGPDGRAIGIPMTRNLGGRLTPNEGLDVASIDNPSGVLIGWSGMRESDAHVANTTALFRLECGVR